MALEKTWPVKVTSRRGRVAETRWCFCNTSARAGRSRRKLGLVQPDARSGCAGHAGDQGANNQKVQHHTVSSMVD
jgi:hypothetical protein